MKDECNRRIIVPTSQCEFEYELSLWATWYNSHWHTWHFMGERLTKSIIANMPQIPCLGSNLVLETQTFQPLCRAANNDGGQDRSKGQSTTHISRRQKTSADLESLARMIFSLPNCQISKMFCAIGLPLM